uniref:Uncharacterized protein n=1 Tax=Oryza sativa subsp. japonica TaxID=39947 RepID=Q6ENJ9_ORYSJ|nr:hypothetical protein [Oryza sativa Japonica Group]BAD29654.1 hypothetical protein [Oryza sativa Japonica Group]
MVGRILTVHADQLRIKINGAPTKGGCACLAPKGVLVHAKEPKSGQNRVGQGGVHGFFLITSKQS